MRASRAWGTTPDSPRSWSVPSAEPLLSWLLVGLEALLLVLGVALVRLPRLRAALAIATAITSLLFVAVGTGLLVKRRVFEEGRRAIVVTEEAALREGPDERTARRGAAHEGDAVHLLGEEEEWVLVELGAHRGWVRRENVGVVD
ncbi:MAG: hypothetical protein H6721_12085 [Sandaracinus sp.]|nr:hypothetical protein [Sandaracinus sp.]